MILLLSLLLLSLMLLLLLLLSLLFPTISKFSSLNIRTQPGLLAAAAAERSAAEERRLAGPGPWDGPQETKCLEGYIIVYHSII